MAEEVVLMKGNEAIAHAAIRCGADGYFGYPITPQSEVLETLAELKPWETTGMVVLQAESEVAAINMVYGDVYKRQAWKGHEVLIATHIDRGHIHTHFIVNSVNFEDGHKLQSVSYTHLDVYKRQSCSGAKRICRT